MPDDDRIDVHMARGNEIMERVEEEMRLTREFHATVLVDFREFTREMIGRVQRIGQEQMAVLRELIEEQRAAREEQRAMREEQHAMGEEQHAMRGEQADLRDESRAQLNALLRILDRLEPGDSNASA